MEKADRMIKARLSTIKRLNREKKKRKSRETHDDIINLGLDALNEKGAEAPQS